MSDPRFARLKSDPRFRRLRKKDTKVIVDDRFKEILDTETTKEKGKTGRVDKYGRPISDGHEKDNLRRFYRLENEETEPNPKPILDYARGEVLLESSDEDENLQSDIDSDDAGHDHSRPIAILNDSDAEIDLDESKFADLDAQAAAYNEAHTEGPEEMGERTRRLATVNLDWEHVRASHLFKICSSLVSPTAPVASSSSQAVNPDRQKYIKGAPSNIGRGKVISVCVYPSEFGKERMAREEIEGPPSKIFKNRKRDDEEINAQTIYDVGGEDEYDKDALRKYQLERLRYYYAIITCDTVDAATHIYTELDGTELERSANVFDLSYVPDEMTFEDECRDQATDDAIPTFKGIDFVTDALRHSKVKLTWDEDDPERNNITRRTLSRKEIDDANFKAYLASSESESDREDVQPSSKTKRTSKKSSRDLLRSLLLGGGDEDLPEGWGDKDKTPGDVDMEVTFTPGLSEKKIQDETTLDVYQRKMREKRKKRKEEVKEKTTKEKADVPEDEFFEPESDKEMTDEPANKKPGKTQRSRPREISPETIRPLTTPEELALLVASDNPNAEPKHFNLKSVLKAEKKSHRKGKKRKSKDEDDTEIQADFTIDVKDDRFKVLHEDHQFAIDPSNPHFKKTNSMSALLEERSKRQRELQGKRSQDSSTESRTGTGEKSLKSLVESVKRKSASSDKSGLGKRRRV